MATTNYINNNRRVDGTGNAKGKHEGDKPTIKHCIFHETRLLLKPLLCKHSSYVYKNVKKKKGIVGDADAHRKFELPRSVLYVLL